MAEAIASRLSALRFGTFVTDKNVTWTYNSECLLQTELCRWVSGVVSFTLTLSSFQRTPQMDGAVHCIDRTKPDNAKAFALQNDC